MPNCSSCGSPIPSGQGRSCSMCYGDIDYGSDGYYREFMESEMEREERQRHAETEQEEPESN